MASSKIAKNDLGIDLYLPEWLVSEVLKKLPVETIFKFKSVCKQWHSLISHPSFAKSYVCANPTLLSSSSLPSWTLFYAYIHDKEFHEILPKLRRCDQAQQQFQIIAASNGLLLCCPGGYRKPLIYYISNPITGQWVALPPPILDTRFFARGLVTQVEGGIIKRYKVVCLEPDFPRDSAVEIFCSETGEWRVSKLHCPEGLELLDPSGPIVYNDILHWLTYCEGLLAYDPYGGGADQCRLIKYPAPWYEALYVGTDEDEFYEGDYRLCNVCRGCLQCFEVPWRDEYFYLWVLIDYDRGEWSIQHKFKLNDIRPEDDLSFSNHSLSDIILHPLALDPFDFGRVFLWGKFGDHVRILSYHFQTKRLKVYCHVDVERLYCWEIIQFVLPLWPATIPQPSWKSIDGF